MTPEQQLAWIEATAEQFLSVEVISSGLHFEVVVREDAESVVCTGSGETLAEALDDAASKLDPE